MKQTISIPATLAVSFLSLFLLLFSGCTTLDTEKKPTATPSARQETTQTPAEVSSTQDTITKAGTYTFSGVTQPIIIEASKDDDIEIILDNVEITSATQAPIYIKEAKDVTITLAKNSINTITDNRTSDADDSNAAIYSMSDLKITGAKDATLVVFGNLNDGITSKDDLKIKEVNITVTAKDDGIIGKDSMEIQESILFVTSGGDALKISNYEDEEKGYVVFETSEITISAGDDAVHAVSSIHFKSGTLDIKKSYEGLESQLITIDGGEIFIVAEDDAVNVADLGYQTEEEKAAKAERSASKLARAAQEESGTQAQEGTRPPRGERPEGQTGGQQGGGSPQEPEFPEGKLIINGGKLFVNSSGDGLDSNGSIFINGGEIIVEGPTNSTEGALDANDTFAVSGGNLIAVGSVGMSQAPDETSTQAVVQLNVDSVQTAGTKITLQDANGSEIFSYTPTKVFQSITYSSPKLTQGETYTLLLNGEKNIEITLNSIVTVYGVGDREAAGGKRGESVEGETPLGLVLPEDWETMTEEERRTFMDANRPQ